VLCSASVGITEKLADKMKYWAIALLTIALISFGVVRATEAPIKNEAVESVDYKAIADKFVSYFKSSDLWEEFRTRLAQLSQENQSALLKYFNMWADELWEDAGRRDKHFLALRMYEIFEMVNRKEWWAVGTVDMFYDKFPQFKDHAIGKSVQLLAQDADYKEWVDIDFTPEQKIELARLKEMNLYLSQKNVDLSQKNVDLSQKNERLTQVNEFGNAILETIESKGVGVKKQ